MASKLVPTIAVAAALAMTTDWPNWHRDDEFRAARDLSRGTK